MNPFLEKRSQTGDNRHWFIARLLAATILLAAAFMKAWQLATTPSLGEGLLHARWFNILVVEFELFFGVWLIFGLLPKLTWLATIACFSAFSLVSLFKAFSGEASCGCFGAAAINPWITTAFDLGMIGFLIRFRPDDIQFRRHDFIAELVEVFRKNRTFVILLVWFLLAVPTTWAMISVQTLDVAELGTEFVGVDGRKKILLEPDSWVGKEFPLAVRFDRPNNHEILKQGVWKVILIHTDCQKCLQMLTDLERKQSENVVVVVVPSHSKEDVPSTSFPIFMLDQKNAWFIPTPYVIKLVDGICTATDENPLE